MLGGCREQRPSPPASALTPQVGITLHYSSLSTLLWMGVKARVLHKELTWRPPPSQDGDPALPAPRPMLRFYLIAGGIPLIICGVTAAVNIHNYRDHSPYCWLVWRPSLGAFYVPVALILLITWIYFLCAGLRVRGPPAHSAKGAGSRLSAEPGEELRGSARLRSSGALLSDSGSLLATGSTGVVTPAPPDSDGLYSPGVQLGALVTTHFLYLAMWACGALAVSQRWLPRVVCSCLYGVAASALGLFVFTHHCARRRDVRFSWRACCPPASPAASHGPARTMPAAPEDGSPVPGEGPAGSLKSSPSGCSAGAPPGPCKLTNLQLAQSQACEAGVAVCGEGEPEPVGSRGSLAPRHSNNLHHGRRAHKSRAKGHRAAEAGGKNRLKALRGGAAPELLSSESGSLHNSPTDSYAGSSRNSPGAGLQREGEPALTPSEGSDTSAAPLPDPGRPGQRRSASRDNLRGGGALEKESKRRSYPLHTASLNGAPKGGKYDDVNVTGAEAAGGACMKTGLWKSETTV